MALEPGKSSIGDHRADGSTEGWCQTFQTNLDWIWLVDEREHEREEVEEGVEVHAGDEGDTVCHCDNALTLEHLVWDHRVGCEFDFPNDEGDDEKQADNQSSEDMGAGPWVSVAACLEGDQAVLYQ